MISKADQPSARRAAPRCNIGDAEVARRRRFAILTTAAGLILAVALVALAAPHVARLLLLPVAAGAGVGWLQVTQRFCVAFGTSGLENFGALGSEQRVADEQAAADRRRALTLILQGVLAGLVVTIVFAVLPV
jgi:predicted nucleic acid-binding Zn ribbon protein